VGGEWWLFVLALGVGIVAALLPAWRAYRTDIAGTLARG
jgi:putative ABC transport system permease protein